MAIWALARVKRVCGGGAGGSRGGGSEDFPAEAELEVGREL